MEKISRVETFPNLVASKEPATVYDVACKSIPELVYLIMQRLNETIEHMNKNDATLQQQLDYVLAQLEDFYLKFDEDLRQEIQIVLQAWIEDGTLEQVISQLVENRAVYPSVAALQQAPNIFQLGAIVELQGYHYAGDGAGHKRIIADKDDGSGVAVGNKFANIIQVGEINLSWIGMTSDSTELHTYFEKAMNIVGDNGTVRIPRGNFETETIVITKNNFSVVGEYSVISTGVGIDKPVFKMSNIKSVNISRIFFANNTASQTNIEATSTHHLNVFDCKSDGTKLFFKLRDCYWPRISNIYMQTIRQAFDMQEAANAFDIRNVSVHGGATQDTLPSIFRNNTMGGDITGCSFEGGSGALKFERCFGCNISGNYFEGFGITRPYLEFGSGNYFDCNGFNITGNLFYKGADVAIKLWRVNGYSIKGNSFTSAHALELYTFDGCHAKNIDYTGNSFEGTGDEIYIYGAESGANISPTFKSHLTFETNLVPGYTARENEMIMRKVGDCELELVSSSDKKMIATNKTLLKGSANAGKTNLGDLGNFSGYVNITRADNGGIFATYLTYLNYAGGGRHVFQIFSKGEVGATLETSGGELILNTASPGYFAVNAIGAIE